MHVLHLLHAAYAVSAAYVAYGLHVEYVVYVTNLVYFAYVVATAIMVFMLYMAYMYEVLCAGDNKDAPRQEARTCWKSAGAATGSTFLLLAEATQPRRLGENHANVGKTLGASKGSMSPPQMDVLDPHIF